MSLLLEQLIKPNLLIASDKHLTEVYVFSDRADKTFFLFLVIGFKLI